MNILLIASTKKEIEIFENYLINNKFKLKKLNIKILVCGIGQNSATFNTTKELLTNSFDLVINIGIAGSYKKELQIGDIICVEKDIFCDLGAEDENEILNLQEIGLTDENINIIENKNYYRYIDFFKIGNVISITSDTIHGEENTINWIKNKYKPDIESMEGGAISFCCSKLKIPFIQIRAISNYVEKRDKTRWDIDLACNNLNNWLIQYFDTFENINFKNCNFENE